MVNTRSHDVDKAPAPKREASAEPDTDAKDAPKARKSAKRDASPAEEPVEDDSKAEEGEDVEETLEHGHIHFMMRPRQCASPGAATDWPGIDHEDDISSLDDIAKLDMVLVPSTKKPAYRTRPALIAADDAGIISIGQKRMAEPGQGDSKSGREHKPMWAAIFGVGDDPSEIAAKLGPKTYTVRLFAAVLALICPDED